MNIKKSITLIGDLAPIFQALAVALEEDGEININDVGHLLVPIKATEPAPISAAPSPKPFVPAPLQPAGTNLLSDVWLPIRKAVQEGITALLALDDAPIDGVKSHLDEIEKLLNGHRPPDQLIAAIQDQSTWADGAMENLNTGKFDLSAVYSALDKIREIAFKEYSDGILGGTDVAGDMEGKVGK